MNLVEEIDRYLEEHKITRLVEVDGVIYAVSASKGLLYLPFRSPNFSQAESPRIRDILVPANDKALYCATSHGIDVFRNGSWSNIRISSNHEFQSNANDVLALAQDSQGNIWIGTSFGLYRMTTPGSFTFLYGDYQIVQGTTIINRQGNSPLQGNLFYNIWSDQKSGLLLFSTNGGLAILKNPAGFNNNSEWIVYTGEHNRSVMQQSTIVTVPQPGNSPLPSNFVQTAIQVGNTIYIGTESGLSAIKDGKWHTYNLDNGLAGDNIKALYLHETETKQILYVGTNGGLSVITHEKQQS
jgi:ligand-binding sensor domain-containing protein